MHVLIISTGYPTDYVPLDGIFYKDQAEALAAQGNKVGFIAVNPISVKSIISHRKLNLGLFTFNEKGVSTYLYKYINIPKYPSYCVKKAEQKGTGIFENYVKEQGLPDIVHLHCYEAVLLAMYIKKKYKIPFVITEHSSRFMNDTVPSTMEKYAETAFNNASLNISVSQKFAEVLKAKYNREFQYVPNIVDMDFYTIINPLSSREKFIFCSAGILNENKNHQLLLHSFSLFIESGRKAQLIIAGDGPESEKLKILSAELKINQQVSFPGWVTRKELAELMHISSVFVLPSKKETFGVVLIEAMSCGLPVISTRSGGPESIIRSRKTGILCDSDPQSLFLAMTEVYDNFAAYDSSLIRQEVQDNYSQHAVSEKLLSIYNRVVKKND
jgi:L-malate glycosyltransferase